MKKHMIWWVTFIASLLLACTALGAPLPPQTVDEIIVPAHTIPVISNIVFSGDTYTMDISGAFDSGYLLCDVETSTGKTTMTAPLTGSGSSFSGSIAALTAGGAACTVTDITLSTYLPDLWLSSNYEINGALDNCYMQDTSTSTGYSFNEQGHLSSYYTDELSVMYDTEGNLSIYTVHLADGDQSYNNLHQLEYEEITDPVTGSVTEKYYDDGILSEIIVTNTDNSRYEYDENGILTSSRIPGANGAYTENRYDTSGNLRTRTEYNADSSYVRYDAQGNLQESRTYGADGSDTVCSYDEDGNLWRRTVTDADNNQYDYDGQGTLISSRITGSDGAITYSEYDENGVLQSKSIIYPDDSRYTYNGQGHLISSISTNADGSMTQNEYDQNGVVAYITTIYQDGRRFEYDSKGILRRSSIQDYGVSMTTNRYDVNGNLHSYMLETEDSREVYDASGALYSRETYKDESRTYEEFKNGQSVHKTVSGYLPDGSYYYDVFENGVYTKRTVWEDEGECHYDANGNYIGKTVYNSMDGSEDYNAKGVMTEYSVFSEEQGGVLFTYNHRRALQSLRYQDPYNDDTYWYDAKEKAWYLNGMPYSGPVPINLKTLQLDKEIVWYPNNTLCSFGPQFRDVAPNLTDLWYMFTPVDLSHDGTQSFELVGGNMYVLGQVSLTVAGDSVTVTYSTIKGKNGHVYMKSEYLNFFKDIKSVTTVVPEELGEGFQFGKAISIQKDLGGDTNVLMFVRNVATFRNFVTDEILLRRFYKNYPSRVTLRDAMLELMD
jgi:YD repeat-containing protein